MKKNTLGTAFILGAGLGTRLLPLTSTCPKPLLPVSGRPIIAYAMEHLLTLGVKRFIVNTHHLPDAFRSAFPEGKWRTRPIIFRFEPRLLDTAGGLKNIEDLLTHEKDIIVYNGDVISDLPLHRLVEAHEAEGKEATLVLRSSGHPLHVCLNGRGEICDFRGALGSKGDMFLFTGIYMVKKEFLARLEPGKPESVVTVFLKMIKENPGSVAGVVIDEGRWHDVGTIPEYERLNRMEELTEKGGNG